MREWISIRRNISFICTTSNMNRLFVLTFFCFLLLAKPQSIYNLPSSCPSTLLNYFPALHCDGIALFFQRSINVLRKAKEDVVCHVRRIEVFSSKSDDDVENFEVISRHGYGKRRSSLSQWLRNTPYTENVFFLRFSSSVVMQRAFSLLAAYKNSKPKLMEMIPNQFSEYSYLANFVQVLSSGEHNLSYIFVFPLSAGNTGYSRYPCHSKRGGYSWQQLLTLANEIYGNAVSSQFLVRLLPACWYHSQPQISWFLDTFPQSSLLFSTDDTANLKMRDFSSLRFSLPHHRVLYDIPPNILLRIQNRLENIPNSKIVNIQKAQNRGNLKNLWRRSSGFVILGKSSAVHFTSTTSSLNLKKAVVVGTRTFELGFSVIFVRSMGSSNLDIGEVRLHLCFNSSECNLNASKAIILTIFESGTVNVNGQMMDNIVIDKTIHLPVVAMKETKIQMHLRLSASYLLVSVCQKISTGTFCVKPDSRILRPEEIKISKVGLSFIVPSSQSYMAAVVENLFWTL